MDYSPPGSSVHGIFQARTLEWVAVSFSRGSSQPRDRTQVSLIAGRHFEPPGKPLSAWAWCNYKVLRRGPSSLVEDLFPGGSDGKASAHNAGRPGFNPWDGRIPWRRKWQRTPVLLPGKSHGWRSRAGYSPWGHKESDMTEQLHLEEEVRRIDVCGQCDGRS